MSPILFGFNTSTFHVFASVFHLNSNTEKRNSEKVSKRKIHLDFQQALDKCFVIEHLASKRQFELLNGDYYESRVNC